MDIVVNEELKAYIDPLTADEYEALERSLLAEGCRDALVLWGNVLVDGHNRYSICSKHGLPFQTVQATRFQSMEDVHLWMIDQHLGRRSLSDYQRGELALRKREITTQRRERARAAATAPEEVAASKPAPPEAAAVSDDALDTREALARAARLSNSQVLQIEKIQRQAAKEVVEAVKAGTISLSAAATVASLPVEEQVAAAVAGKDELRQAAKRVRESRRKRPAADTGDEMLESQEVLPPPAPGIDEHTVETLRQRVAELVAQNMALHQQVAQLKAQLARHEGAGEGANGNENENENGGDAPPWE